MSDLFYQLETHPSAPQYRNTKGQRVISVHLVAKLLCDTMHSTHRYNTDDQVWYIFQDLIWMETKTIYHDVLEKLELLRDEFRIRLENDADTINRMYTAYDQLLNQNFVHLVISNMEANKKMFISAIDFDTDITLLNTPKAVYDLNTSEELHHAASYMCRKITNVSPLDDNDGAMCPNYINHLKFVTNNDPELITYLEELSGYILTGETFQQEFYWFQGLALTGKSALIGIWLYILNEDGYSCTGKRKQFAETYNEAHEEQDYMLIGKRFVSIDEPKGDKWDAEKLKAYTSGLKVSARPMYGSSIKFMPECKLFFTSNNKPQVDGSDTGMGRRLKLLQFNRVIPPDMRIKKFDVTVLQQEAPYILNRMIKNAAVVLKRQNLSEPQVVTDLSNSYMQSNDLLNQFVADCCTAESYDREIMKNLFKAFTIWCDENSYDCPSQNKFGRMLGNAGKDLVRQGGKSLRAKIKLTEEWSKKVGLYQNSLNN